MDRNIDPTRGACPTVPSYPYVGKPTDVIAYIPFSRSVCRFSKRSRSDRFCDRSLLRGVRWVSPCGCQSISKVYPNSHLILLIGFDSNFHQSNKSVYFVQTRDNWGVEKNERKSRCEQKWELSFSACPSQSCFRAQGDSADVRIIAEDTISVSCRSTFAHSRSETFLDSSAPPFNFYPEVSIFDLQSNRRASGLRIRPWTSARYTERHISRFSFAN